MNPLGNLNLFETLTRSIGFKPACEFELCETGDTQISYDRRCDLFLCEVHRQAHECKVLPFVSDQKTPQQLLAEAQARKLQRYYQTEIVPGFQARGYKHCQACDTWFNPRGRCRCEVQEQAK